MARSRDLILGVLAQGLPMSCMEIVGSSRLSSSQVIHALARSVASRLSIENKGLVHKYRRV